MIIEKHWIFSNSIVCLHCDTHHTRTRSRARVFFLRVGATHTHTFACLLLLFTVFSFSHRRRRRRRVPLKEGAKRGPRVGGVAARAARRREVANEGVALLWVPPKVGVEPAPPHARLACVCVRACVSACVCACSAPPPHHHVFLRCFSRCASACPRTHTFVPSTPPPLAARHPLHPLRLLFCLAPSSF